MRVASRRLRALLRSLAGAFPPRQAERIRNELRWLNTLLSPVRDCDVQLHTLERYEGVLAADRRAALEPYRSYLLREREAHREVMRNGLDSRRYFSVLLWLERYSIARRPPHPATGTVPAAEAGRKALKHAFRQLIRRGAEVGSPPTAEELHRIRIRAKRLRYLLEFFGDSSGKAGVRLLQHLVNLQDLLGVHNDAMVAAAFLERYVNGPGADSKPATLLTLGGFLEDELRRARKARTKFRRTWKRFASKQTIKDWKAVQRRLKREAAAVAARATTRPAAAERGRA
jgi:CHAD domain-containing protein